MADYTLQLLTTNYSGQIANITFSPCSGGTINLGSQILPYDYVSEYVYGDYDLFFSAYNQTCYVSVPCPSPTPTETPTTTPTPTNTVTPTTTPTTTPTPSPIWLLSILNTNLTRSVAAVNFNGVTESLELGSYPVVNGNGYSATHPSVSGVGGDVVVITFGGTGFCGPNSKILKNGVDTGYPLAGYAGNPFTLGGLAFASGDQITIIID